MAEITEKFNVEEVKNKMSALETAFNMLSDALSEANKIVNEEVNVGPESALFGELGTVLLNTWNENASTFGDFHANFESWAQIVSVIAANNISFTEETISAYKDNGSTLTYKDDTTGERKSITELRSENVKEQAINYVKNRFPDSKYVITEDGNLVIVKDADGNMVAEYNIENGKIISLKLYDIDGNYSLTEYVTGADGKTETKVTYYDKYNTLLEDDEKPDSFSKDGNMNEVSLIDAKDGDKLTVNGVEATVNVNNGVKTITYEKDGEIITLEVTSAGNIKILPGKLAEIEINGQKVKTVPYSSEELADYYAKLNNGKSSYSYMDENRNEITVTIGDDCTVVKVEYRTGGSKETYSYDNGEKIVISKRNNTIKLTKQNSEGNDIPIDIKEAITLAKSNGLEKLTYTDSDGNSKTLTVTTDENGRFIVSDGTNSYDENGDPFSNTSGSIVDIVKSSESTVDNTYTEEILEYSKKNVYSIDATYEHSKPIRIYGEKICDECEELKKSLWHNGTLIKKYLENNKKILTDEKVVNFLTAQKDSMYSISISLGVDVKVGDGLGDDGIFGDAKSFVPVHTWKTISDKVNEYNKKLEDISSIDDLNEALKKLGYPQIEETN